LVLSALARKFDPRIHAAVGGFVFGDAFHELGQIVLGEVPFVGSGCGFVAALGVEEPLLEIGEVACSLIGFA
jgi:hypothetical protein